MNPSPCACKGSNGIHYTCLAKAQEKYSYCGVCRKNYSVLCDGLHTDYVHGNRITYETVGGKKHGFFKEYDEDDVLHKKIRFEHGILHGSYVVYHGDGKTIMVECTYEHGLKQGPLYEYNENGSLVSVEQYTNDLKHGDVHVFFDSGEIFQTYSMVHGEKCGDVKEFDITGKLAGAWSKMWGC